MISFTNSGEIDPRLIYAFGVNVKDNDSAIGYFGTGLKYAIAVALRNDCEVTIWSGLTSYTFTTCQETIRGKDFEFVWCNNERMAFTLDLGRNWASWMAYREFYCNAVDEHGTVFAGETSPSSGITVVQVEGAAIVDAHIHRREFLLDSGLPRWCSPKLSILNGSGQAVFYRGVKVFETPQPLCYTYDIQESLKLTEDRTIADWGIAENVICHALLDVPSPILKRVLTAPEGTMEHNFYWSTWAGFDSPRLREIIREIDKSHLTPYARRLQQFLLPESKIPAKVKTLTPATHDILAQATTFCSFLGYPITEEVIVTDDLGPDVLGMAQEGKIYLSTRAFLVGAKCVAGTLLEEHFHITHKMRDYSSQFQNFLIDLVVTIGEMARGRRL